MLFKNQKLTKDEREEFYQSKYDRLKKLNKLVVIICCVLEAAFFAFDCIFGGEFSWNTLIPRFFILIPLAAFLIFENRITSYKVMVPFSYLMLHICMWTSIWATVYLENAAHVQEAFLAIHIMFLAVGFCAPTSVHIFYHAITVINIAISSVFISYDNLILMLIVSAGLVIGVWFLEFVVDNLIIQQFLTEKRAEEMTRRDQLTGAYNRKHLTKLCIDESSELIYKIAGIIIIDIDDFNTINDSHTHEGGDKILIELYKIIDVCIRSNDCCIRWSGDQFTVIIANQGLARTKDIAERIRNKVNTSESAVHNYKVSMGVTIYKGGDYFESIRDAETALTFAKKNGKNMVIAYEDMKSIVP